MEGDINCHVEEENTAPLNKSVTVSTQVTVEILKDKESEFNEKFNIVFPAIRRLYSNGEILVAKEI